VATGPRLAADTEAAEWLKEALPESYDFVVGDLIPSHLSSIARIGDFGGGEEYPPGLVRPFVETLGRHTETPDRCWFCIWDGYGWIAGSVSVGLFGAGLQAPAVRPSSGLPPEALERPRVERPLREYLLFEGTLESTKELGWRQGEVLDREYPEGELELPAFSPQVPDLMWPEDRAWFFATDTDFDWAYLGGGGQLIADRTAALPNVTRAARADRVD